MSNVITNFGRNQTILSQSTVFQTQLKSIMCMAGLVNHTNAMFYYCIKNNAIKKLALSFFLIRAFIPKTIIFIIYNLI